MFMWGSCLCGVHVHVGFMSMGGSCSCGVHVYVGFMFVWGSCLCGVHVIRSSVLFVGVVDCCLSFCTFSLGHYADSDYPFSIFKLFLIQVQQKEK
jgi:hypothetical protein